LETVVEKVKDAELLSEKVNNPNDIKMIDQVNTGENDIEW